MENKYNSRYHSIITSSNLQINFCMVLNRHRNMYFLTDIGKNFTMHDNAMDV